jgi:hypothetical protein
MHIFSHIKLTAIIRVTKLMFISSLLHFVPVLFLLDQLVKCTMSASPLLRTNSADSSNTTRNSCFTVYGQTVARLQLLTILLVVAVEGVVGVLQLAVAAAAAEVGPPVRGCKQHHRKKRQYCFTARVWGSVCVICTIDPADDRWWRSRRGWWWRLSQEGCWRKFRYTLSYALVEEVEKK